MQAQPVWVTRGSTERNVPDCGSRQQLSGRRRSIASSSRVLRPLLIAPRPPGSFAQRLRPKSPTNTGVAHDKHHRHDNRDRSPKCRFHVGDEEQRQKHRGSELSSDGGNTTKTHRGPFAGQTVRPGTTLIDRLETRGDGRSRCGRAGRPEVDSSRVTSTTPSGTEPETTWRPYQRRFHDSDRTAQSRGGTPGVLGSDTLDPRSPSCSVSACLRDDSRPCGIATRQTVRRDPVPGIGAHPV